MSQDNKPKYLYRGVVIPYTKLDEFKFTGVDLVVPYEPLLDDQGRKVVLDGNEYGVYMTDNEQMVKDVYGNVHNGGMPLQNNLAIGFPPIRIVVPDIGISYNISTDGILVRQPRITSTLQGHYNNGFAGDEWIADKVPSDNYQVTRIRIGRDMLHNAEDIQIVDGDINQAKEETRKNIEMRKYRLESFANEVLKMSEIQRRNISSAQMDVLKDIFGPNGIRYMNINSIAVSSNMGKIQYLLASFYNQNPGIIDYKTLEYIETLKQRLVKSITLEAIEVLNQIILDDLKLNDEKKESFIQRKSEEGTPAKTDMFDNKNAMMSAVLNRLVGITRQNNVEQRVSDGKIVTAYSNDEETISRVR